MPMALLIENTPDDIVKLLRQRADKHGRSLQGELLAIVEAALLDLHTATPAEILAEVRRLGLITPNESSEIIRTDRQRSQ